MFSKKVQQNIIKTKYIIVSLEKTIELLKFLMSYYCILRHVWAKTLEKLKKTFYITGADRIGAESDSGVFKWK